MYKGGVMVNPVADVSHDGNDPAGAVPTGLPPRAAGQTAAAESC